METGIRLLMVEDVPEEAELAALQLTRAGIEHTLRRVETEAGLRNALSEFDPSIILSDFTLPRFDGMSALHIAQQLRPEIPFVFFSGTIGEERAIQALTSGATDYVLKGNAHRLASAVTRALAERGERVARLHAERLLRDSEERFRSIVETSADWIWETDRDGTHLFCNPCVEAILGYARKELVGASRLARVHADDRARLTQMFKEGAESRRGWRGVVLRWVDSAGEIRWLESNAVVRLAERGEVLGFRGVDRDVTDRRRDEERIRRLSRVHAVLSNTNSTIVRVRDRDELLREACRVAVTHGQYALAWAGLIDESRERLVKTASAGLRSEFFGDGPFALSLTARGPESLLLRALRTRQRVVLDRGHSNGARSTLRRAMAALGLEGAIVLPLLVGDDAVGVFALAGASQQLFDDGEIKLLEELAGDLTYALQYIRQEAHLRYLANYDALTGLANRELFGERLQQCIDTATPGTQVAVTLFDVERLSDFNHTLGRHRGDQLLRQIAGRLQQQAQDGGRAGYFGGGVFAAMLAGLASEAEASRLPEWIDQHLLAELFSVDGEELRIAGRQGVALHPADGANAAALLTSAEIALRNAKSAGERVMYSSPQLNARVANRLSIASRLRHALEREQFELHFQPKIAIASGAVVGFEALLRWRDPASAAVQPELFVPVLEETGLIEPVGQWVLGEAARLGAEWRAAGRNTRIAVNVCARQLARRDFAQQVRAVLDRRTAADPGLDIEITESALLADLQGSIRRLEQIRAMGLKIAIDDFGTGYSSLSQLVRLPVDTLKIDKSFVQGMSKDASVRAIVATITSLGQSLKLNTVAEGVETQEQLMQLRELGCREYQGYLFSPPISAAAALQLLSRA